MDNDLTQDLFQWVFSDYVPTWAAIGRSERDAKDILNYWSVPMFAASMHGIGWLMDEEAVIGLLATTHAPLKTSGYDNTKPLDRAITVYNDHSASADAIWSRRRADETEIERVATHFDIRLTEAGWRIIGLSNQYTQTGRLADVWASRHGA
ncbi:DUF6841 family protein [Ruegeria jejuensis]|uniref:DUF6841 family protein n=1 Tax=Ruegeria jejuensis TaxID=3233338 RepID=UPI00355BF0AA